LIFIDLTGVILSFIELFIEVFIIFYSNIGFSFALGISRCGIFCNVFLGAYNLLPNPFLTNFVFGCFFSILVLLFNVSLVKLL
jgi:hypothetical protein